MDEPGNKGKKKKRAYTPNVTRQQENKARRIVRHIKTHLGFDAEGNITDKNAVETWKKLPLAIQKKFPLPTPDMKNVGTTTGRSSASSTNYSTEPATAS